MPPTSYSEAARLILSERWAAMATINDGAPLASMVAYAAEPGLSGLILHLSQMAAHTRALLAVPDCSIAISRPDTGEGDPQLLARVAIEGIALPLEEGTRSFESARDCYVARFPHSAQRLHMGDFVFFRFEIQDARWVGGFGRAVRMNGLQLKEAAASLV